MLEDFLIYLDALFSVRRYGFGFSGRYLGLFVVTLPVLVLLLGLWFRTLARQQAQVEARIFEEMLMQLDDDQELIEEEEEEGEEMMMEEEEEEEQEERPPRQGKNALNVHGKNALNAAVEEEEEEESEPEESKKDL